jgi:Cu/Ag efflux pump CusA
MQPIKEGMTRLLSAIRTNRNIKITGKATMETGVAATMIKDVDTIKDMDTTKKVNF